MTLQNPVRSAKLKRYPNGNIYQGFGENPALYQPYGLKYHNGIDLATFEGDEILAAHDGVVVDVRISSQGYGNSVLLLSDKVDGKYILTRYSHLRIYIPVVAGQQVKAGDVIGYESNTGFVVSRSTAFWGNAPANKGVHLHFGVCPLREEKPADEGVVLFRYYFPSINKTFIAINGDNGVHGYEDPMPYFINTMYKYAIDENKNQHILYTDLKIDIEISDAQDLDKLVANGLTGAPEHILSSELNGYYTIVGVEKARFSGLMKDLFNL